MTPKITSDYARADDGAYIAYKVLGEGPVDITWQLGGITNLEVEWDSHWGAAWYEGLASFSRLILHDRRGTGNSSRNVPPPNLETRAADLRTVLDHVGSTTTVLGGWFEDPAPQVLLATTEPDRARALVWWNPEPCQLWKPDYPWGADRGTVERELRMYESWGTDAHGEAYAAWWEEELGVRPSDAEISWKNRVARTTCTPDVALAMRMIEFDTDVRALLPSLQAPTLLITSHPQHVEIAGYIASLIPNATVSHAGAWDAWPRTRPDADEMARPYLAAIRDFLGVESPPRRDLDTVVTTLLFTDIVDSTTQQAKLGDEGWRQVRERHDGIVRDHIGRYRGREIKTMGDGFLVTFDGPARAIRCACNIVEEVSALGIKVRAGLHTGEITLEAADISGIGVAIGARVGALAGASEVLVSQTVKDLVAGSGLTFEDAGEHELKGVPDRWHLYRVVG